MKSLLGIEILIHLFICSYLIGQDGIIPEESILNSNEFSIRNNNIEPNNKDSNRDSSLNLNEKLKQTLSKYSPLRLRIESVSPRTVLLFSLPFGAETTFLIGKNYSQQLNDTTEPVYAIGALCWNVPCSNQTLLRLNNVWKIKPNQVQTVQRPLIQWNQNDSTIYSPFFFNPSLNNLPQGQQNNQNVIQNPPNNSNELIFPNDNDLAKEIIVKIGNGYQKKRGELFAALAFSAIATDYEIRLDGQKFLIKNLIESEKRRCFLHEDLSQLAIGFSIYLPDFQEEWKNAWNEVWTLEKLAKYELLRPIDWGSSESTDKLLGLTFLLQRTEKELSN
ncbi:MAG: hypothetical protein Q4C95_10595, partial [Planctomycetia bacterium]|nr:hypothetical protein [Planctomycetia bacterium]